jgi:hypothetical protein
MIHNTSKGAKRVPVQTHRKGQPSTASKNIRQMINGAADGGHCEQQKNGSSMIFRETCWFWENAMEMLDLNSSSSFGVKVYGIE